MASRTRLDRLERLIAGQDESVSHHFQLHTARQTGPDEYRMLAGTLAGRTVNGAAIATLPGLVVVIEDIRPTVRLG